MKKQDRWLLPDGVEEVLPQDAARLENLRRQLLDLYASWSYDLVAPPMIEFLESLNIGAGTDLALQTFTITDQLSGRLMGVRADITPQVARIDAHTLDKQGVVRLCYCGTVLHSTPANFSESRAVEQVGIELFGSSSIHADIEVVRLMLASVEKAGGLSAKTGLAKLDLGHVGIFRNVAGLAKLNSNLEQELCAILQRKAQPELAQFVAINIADPLVAELLLKLLTLCGGLDILAEAKALFNKVSEPLIKRELLQALDDLCSLAKVLETDFPQVEPYFDLGELRGYNYHTGLVFAIYKDAYAEPLAKGGRYDHIGESFGRSRPATGFSADLKILLALHDTAQVSMAIAVPLLASGDKGQKALGLKVAELRNQGEVLAQSLALNDEHRAECCDRELVFENECWLVKMLSV